MSEDAKTFEDGIACAFDLLKFAACNTDNELRSDTLEEMAEELIEYAPAYKRQWKDILKLEAENKALFEQNARLRDELAVKKNFEAAYQFETELESLRSRVVVVPDEREAFDAAYQKLCDEGWKDVHRACWWIWQSRARLNGKTVSEADLRKWLELMEHGDFREGHCMCGSAVDSHGIYDGHAPTDAGEYYAGQIMEELRALLDAGKEDGNG